MKAPGVYFWYAKAVGLLDYVVLTDNDRETALEKVLDDVAYRDVVQVSNEEYNEDGSFVSFVGFEWTSREHGNRLVIFSEPPESVPSVASGFDTPQKLRDALPGRLHRDRGAPRPDPSRIPRWIPRRSIGRISSRSTPRSARSTFPGSPRATTQETAGAFVHDLLKRGHRLGMVGSSDSRLSTPGNPYGFPIEDHPWQNGLTAIVAKELTRESLLEALRERRCYATTGQRYLMEFTVDGNQMGSELRVPSGHEAKIYGSLGATTRWIRVELPGPGRPRSKS